MGLEEMGLSRQGQPSFSKLPVQIISPPLHHLRALLEVLRVVVGPRLLCSAFLWLRVLDFFDGQRHDAPPTLGNFIPQLFGHHTQTIPQLGAWL